MFEAVDKSMSVLCHWSRFSLYNMTETLGDRV